MFSQFVNDFIGYGIGTVIFSIPLIMAGSGFHSFVMGHRRQNLRRIEEANSHAEKMKKIEANYKECEDLYCRPRSNYLYF